ncbi:single-stranded-DNA-specific exonuclease RecJ [Methanobacterium alcaliphilum]|nr:single-stranded-DNA-specific exonuclease RecJ [Methanobacterium alcaliphilum]MCK9151642.1 single-stranded-DNA-specific exonuclease RecJ [Methanobacterium alcaliphilum]
MIPAPMDEALLKAKKMVESSEDIKIYSHIDCDGITAGAILSILLDRIGKEHEIEFIQLDKIDDIKLENELTIFSDLGSGQKIDELSTSLSKILILDHHPSLRNPNFNNSTLQGQFLEINPLFHGIEGSHEISGGGMSYLLARSFGFIDLSWMGVLSAVGDMQNSLTGKLEGLNRLILNESTDLGKIKSMNDLSIYGRQTRPLFVALSYFGDVNLPITNNKTECILLLKSLDIPRKNGKSHRSLCDLNPDEKGRLFSELVRMLSKEVPSRYIKYVPKLVSADAYDFVDEEPYTPLRDASEFSTAVNACSRNKKPDVALNILKGNRSDALDEMEALSKEHRRYLAQKIELIENSDMITPMNNLQYFDGNGIKSEVIGTIAGMVLNYGDWRKPIIGFTPVNDGNNGTKVSLRCSRLLAYDGIHFGHIIRKVAEKVGGSGGGHSVACGAYIPPGKQQKFLEIFDSSLEGLV